MKSIFEIVNARRRAIRQSPVIDGSKRDKVFKLRRAGFKGNGLRPDLRDASWRKVRHASYEDCDG